MLLKRKMPQKNPREMLWMREIVEMFLTKVKRMQPMKMQKNLRAERKTTQRKMQRMLVM